MREARHWWFLISIVGAVMVAYAGGLSGPFLYDDTVGIVKNESIRSLWPLSEVLSPPRDKPQSGRPIANLSLALSYALGGLEPVGYRVLNLLLHLGSALLVFGILRRVLASAAVPSLLRPGADWMALCTALLWGVHAEHA